MDRVSWFRLLLTIGCAAALGLASIIASQRTAASLAAAAERFLGTLSPASANTRRWRSTPRTVSGGTTCRPRDFPVKACESRT